MSEVFQENEAGIRYARAFFDLALENGDLEKVYADLGKISGLLSESADLRRFVASAVFDSATKAKGVTAVTKSLKLQALTKKLLGVLATNNRLSQLGAVIASFNKIYASHKGIVSAEVTSAVPLSDAQTKTLTAALKKALGAAPEITTKVDETLLGGLKVRVGSRLFDASLKTQLDSLKFALKKA